MSFSAHDVVNGPRIFETSNAPASHASTDGGNWTVESLPLNYGPMQTITYAQGQFVALGQLNMALISSDGLVWQPESSAATNNLRSLTFGNGVYVAVGDRGALVTSSDAMTWTNRSMSSTIFWYGVAYGHGWYVAIGSPLALGVSSNAVDWTLRTPMRAVSLGQSYGIVSGDDSFLLAGRFGQVLESAPFNAPTPQITLGLRLTDRPFLSFTAPEWHGYEIDGSDVLPPVWVPLATGTNLSATTTLPVSAATNSPARFYRAKLLN